MLTRLTQGLIGSAIIVSIAHFGAAPAAAEDPVPSPETAASASHWSQGTSTLTLENTTLATFEFEGVRHFPLFADKTVDGATTYAFDVVGDPGDGTTELFGGISFYRDGGCAIVSDLVIDPAGDTVTGRVNFGEPVALFVLGGGTDEGTAWHFTADGAAAFNEELGITSLRPGRILGYDATAID
ncbi:hypothetical protein [Glycomyces tenuis]|uniref:hypothetical protein n=1 Tax=Glycomyces tenuis TaxID=58116 RepID=UPI00041D170F|nr:hypothetical protein [Glycomyces tenuis]